MCCRGFLSVCLLATLRKTFARNFREGCQWASEQVVKFWRRPESGYRDCFPDSALLGWYIRKVANGHSFISICQMVALVRRALAEVCTVPVLLTVVCVRYNIYDYGAFDLVPINWPAAPGYLSTKKKTVHNRSITYCSSVHQTSLRSYYNRYRRLMPGYNDLYYDIWIDLRGMLHNHIQDTHWSDILIIWFSETHTVRHIPHVQNSQ